ncbi:MAG: hypothetical protein Q8P63_03260 [Candidatus Nealsonbacteria bacterium]|nr:hypothetical protein [Candidatus Nealsonbacteria bacterium]
MTIAILLSLFLGAVHFWNEKIFFKQEATKAKTMSFVAGASVAYVFLYLLPDLYKGVAHINQWIFIFILLGFSLVHILEKYLYQHAGGEERSLRLKEAHFLIFFLYYFIIGIIMVDFLKINLWTGLLFFLPIVFYAAVSRVSLEKVHIRIREQRFFRILLASAVLLGALSSSAVLEQIFLYHILLAFVIGAFFYIVIMDFIPREAKGRPSYFILGAGLYTILIALTWIVQ